LKTTSKEKIKRRDFFKMKRNFMKNSIEKLVYLYIILKQEENLIIITLSVIFTMLGLFYMNNLNINHKKRSSD